jgi:membrane protein implicated in regulation of membrane protease activity
MRRTSESGSPLLIVLGIVAVIGLVVNAVRNPEQWTITIFFLLVSAGFIAYAVWSWRRKKERRGSEPRETREEESHTPTDAPE